MIYAAMVLGVLGGAVGMIVGFFGYGFVELYHWASSWLIDVAPQAAQQISPVEDEDRIQLLSLLAPVAAVAGGPMVLTHRFLGAMFLGGSAGGMYYGFAFNVFTMFPIAMCGLAAVLALLAGPPSRPSASS
ncbi:MAG: hypothetical protein AAF677_06990 [Pseudomonadota bacterium]